jgi:hypothetical protein
MGEENPGRVEPDERGHDRPSARGGSSQAVDPRSLTHQTQVTVEGREPDPKLTEEPVTRTTAKAATRQKSAVPTRASRSGATASTAPAS